MEHPDNKADEVTVLADVEINNYKKKEETTDKEEEVKIEETIPVLDTSENRLESTHHM